MPSKLGSFSVGCPTIFQHPTSTKSLCGDYQKVWPLGRCLIVLPKTLAMDRIKRGWLFMGFFSQDHANNKCSCHCYQFIFQFDCQYCNNFYEHGDLES